MLAGIVLFSLINLFQATCLYLYVLKTSEIQRFYYVFRGFLKRPVTLNGLTNNCCTSIKTLGVASLFVKNLMTHGQYTKKNVFAIDLCKKVLFLSKKGRTNMKVLKFFLPYITSGNFEMQKHPPEMLYNKKLFLGISEYSQENTCVNVSF